MKIAIDGPAGAGKSTVAKLLAQKLGFIYIDTGAMYRALTLKALRLGVNLEDTKNLTELAKSISIYFKNEGDQQYIYCDGENVTEEIRTPEVSNNVSKIAAYTSVREIMVKQQQEMARSSSVVMDGRDIGECVLPDADFKFYLTASIEERAKRRILELTEQGYDISFEEIKEDIISRDNNDANREVGALKILEDSIVIDSSNKNITEVLDSMIQLINRE